MNPFHVGARIASAARNRERSNGLALEAIRVPEALRGASGEARWEAEPQGEIGITYMLQFTKI